MRLALGLSLTALAFAACKEKRKNVADLADSRDASSSFAPVRNPPALPDLVAKKVNAPGALAVLYDVRRYKLTKTNCTAVFLPGGRAVTAGHCLVQVGAELGDIRLRWRNFDKGLPGLTQKSVDAGKIPKLSALYAKPDASDFVKVTGIVKRSYDEQDPSAADFALLTYDAGKSGLTDANALTVAKAPAKPGQSVVVLGFPSPNPWTVESLNASRGCTTASTPHAAGDAKFDVTCGVKVGASGGPVLDATTGEVLGIVSMGSSTSGSHTDLIAALGGGPAASEPALPGAAAPSSSQPSAPPASGSSPVSADDFEHVPPGSRVTLRYALSYALGADVQVVAGDADRTRPSCALERQCNADKSMPALTLAAGTTLIAEGPMSNYPREGDVGTPDPPSNFQTCPVAIEGDSLYMATPVGRHLLLRDSASGALYALACGAPEEQMTPSVRLVPPQSLGAILTFAAP